MLKGANISFIGFLVLLACAYSWAQLFECDLRTGEGCTNSSEHEVFTVISKGYRNDSGDVNKECKHFLKLKVKLTYELSKSYTGRHITTLSCRLELEGRPSYYGGPMITVSEDPDTTEATQNSPYFKGEGGNYRFSSRRNEDEFEQITSGADYDWEFSPVFFENGRFRFIGGTLLGPAVFTPEHPEKELYIGINMQYAQVKTERRGLVTYSDKIGGGACKIRCDTWDYNNTS